MALKIADGTFGQRAKPLSKPYARLLNHVRFIIRAAAKKARSRAAERLTPLKGCGMMVGAHISALLCVSIVAVGQILFKLTADSITSAGTILDRRVIGIGVASLMTCGIATLLWVQLLKTAPLSRAYPYVALNFVIIAVASRLFFHETISSTYAVGLILIVTGIVLSAIR